MEHKTNAMRELDKLKIKYNFYSYVGTDAVSGVEVASVLKQNPDRVFKTLVTVGKSGKHYVFMLPVAQELNLKKAAKSVGEKSVEMISLAAKKYGEEINSFDDLLPLSNLVTLSFDDCNGYRGACHRHPNEQSIYISSESSTPGIINSPITEGMWSVTLNVHFVGSDEVEYSIKIEGE